MINPLNVRLALERIARKTKGVPVRYIDDVGEPRDDGTFVSLRLECAGQAAEYLILTTENFYAALGKVMQKALPAFGGDKLS